MPAEPPDLYAVLIRAIAARDLSELREALAASTGERRTVVNTLFAQAVLSGIAPPEFVDFLLAQGADPNARDTERPLLARFLAKGANLNLEVLDLLLAASPDVNAVDGEGATALMMAASRDGYGRAQAIERLLALGADPCVRDVQGRTPVDWAAAARRHRCPPVAARHLSRTVLRPLPRGESALLALGVRRGKPGRSHEAGRCNQRNRWLTPNPDGAWSPGWKR